MDKVEIGGDNMGIGHDWIGQNKKKTEEDKIEQDETEEGEIEQDETEEGEIEQDWRNIYLTMSPSITLTSLSPLQQYITLTSSHGTKLFECDWGGLGTKRVM